MNATLSPKISATLLLLLMIMTLSSESIAQSWQWGKRGGGIGEPQNVIEDINRIATDKAGNVYVLGHVYSPNIIIGNQGVTGYGAQDIAVSSWSCNGTFRWSKIIGTPYADHGQGIALDTLGGVYISGYVVSGFDSVHISTDTSFYTGATYKNLFVVKYDTGGHYKWLRMPQADTVGTGSQSTTGAVDLDVDGGGNIKLLARLSPGAYANGNFVVNNRGFYLLRYSNAGVFQSGVNLNLNYKGYPYLLNKMQMSCDHRNGRTYIAGTIEPLYSNDTLMVGSTTINRPMYIMCFDAQGNNLWVKQSTTSGYTSGFRGHPAIDGSGNIYLGGTSFSGEVFNGTTLTNLGPSSMPIVVKLDSNGNNVWLKSGETNAGTYGSDIVLNSNGEVALLGAYPGSVSWAGYNKSLNHAVNTGFDIFLTRLNAQTGAVTGMDSIASNFGVDEYANAIAADNRGNVFTGGYFSGIMYVNHDTIEKIGGTADWFVAKFGFNNCNCTMPIASFGYNTVATTVNFTYGGSTPVDSVRWTFGDGTSSTLQSPSHNYPASGNYTACLTVYNSCGHKDTCRTIQVSSSVNNINALADVQVYPNPVQDQLTIESPVSYHAAIVTIDGRVLTEQEITAPRTLINIRNLPSGMYLLQLTDANGQRGVVKIVKQ